MLKLPSVKWCLFCLNPSVFKTLILAGEAISIIRHRFGLDCKVNMDVRSLEQPKSNVVVPGLVVHACFVWSVAYLLQEKPVSSIVNANVNVNSSSGNLGHDSDAISPFIIWYATAKICIHCIFRYPVCNCWQIRNTLADSWAMMLRFFCL